MKITVQMLILLLLLSCSRETISDQQAFEILSKTEIQISLESKEYVNFSNMLNREDMVKTSHMSVKIDSLKYYKEVYDSTLKTLLLCDSIGSKQKQFYFNNSANKYQNYYIKITHHKIDFPSLILKTPESFPLDSGKYQLLLNESSWAFMAGCRAVVSEVSYCLEPTYFEGIKEFSSSDTILQKDENYLVHLSLAAIPSLALLNSRDTKLKVEVFKDGIVLHRNLWDTIFTNENQYELLIQPKEIGSYNWFIEYTYLDASGAKTEKRNSSFKVVK